MPQSSHSGPYASSNVVPTKEVQQHSAGDEPKAVWQLRTVHGNA